MDLLELERSSAQCELCELSRTRNKAVFARGNDKASIMVCGMCPGPDENKIGYPFVGKAGDVLNTVLTKVVPNNVKPAEYVYITNLVKCFVTPGIKLEDRWMDSCLPCFIVQLNIIKPKVIIGLGKDVCNYLLGVDEAIGKLRNNIYDYLGFKFICSYHPSYLSRGGGIKHRDFSKVVDDFSKAVSMA